MNCTTISKASTPGVSVAPALFRTCGAQKYCIIPSYRTELSCRCWFQPVVRRMWQGAVPRSSLPQRLSFGTFITRNPIYIPDKPASLIYILTNNNNNSSPREINSINVPAPDAVHCDGSTVKDLIVSSLA